MREQKQGWEGMTDTFNHVFFANISKDCLCHLLQLWLVHADSLLNPVIVSKL